MSNMIDKLGPWFSLTDAAAISDKSRVTLRRYLDADKFPNARQDPDDVNNAWLVPLQDLEAAGIRIVGDDTGEADPVMGLLVVRLARAEALAEARGAEIVRLERVLAIFARQTDLLAAAIQRQENNS